jgi:hypothetical protein
MIKVTVTSPAAAPASARAPARKAAVEAEPSLILPTPMADGNLRLLERIKADNFAFSPALYAGAGAIVFLYALVLFAALSEWKKYRLAHPPQVAHEPAVVAELPPPPVLPPIKPPPSAPPKDAPPSNPAPKQAPPPASTSPPVVAVNIPKASPKPSEKRQAKKKDQPPAEKKPEPDIKTHEHLETWVDSDSDCILDRQKEADSVVIFIPEAPHFLSPDLQVANAPRLLTDWKGDFIAVCKVLGEFQPGRPDRNNPIRLQGKRLPGITFQGAGLLLWQDEKNFLRFELAALSAGKPVTRQIMVEVWKDGKPLQPTGYLPAPDGPILLRMERLGEDIFCFYQPENESTAIPLGKLTPKYPSEIKVGLSASSISTNVFSAHIGGFALAKVPKETKETKKTP